jgi:hypothetical protein
MTWAWYELICPSCTFVPFVVNALLIYSFCASKNRPHPPQKALEKFYIEMRMVPD